MIPGGQLNQWSDINADEKERETNRLHMKRHRLSVPTLFMTQMWCLPHKDVTFPLIPGSLKDPFDSFDSFWLQPSWQLNLVAFSNHFRAILRLALLCIVAAAVAAVAADQNTAVACVASDVDACRVTWEGQWRS